MVLLIILVILLPLILFFILINLYNRNSGEQQRLIETLYDQVKNLTAEVSGLAKELKGKRDHTPLQPTQEVVVEETIVTAPERKETPAPVELPPIITIEEPEPETASLFTVREKQVAEKKESWLPANNNWEKFIGENLASKIGIAVLVLGIAFFVKYAIDQNWIKEAGRVIIGLISGGLLIGFAHYFRNSYRSFSSVLVGGGLTVFYFSIAFAFHQYHLIGQLPAFIIMVIISAFGVALSLFYNRQELAILATLGGFVTPFLVSTGQENYIALFTYLCILNTGLMVLAWFKRWPSINTIALFFTTLIYGGWLVKRIIFEDPETLPHQDAFIFATLFYLLFMAMNMINTLRLREKFRSFDFIIVLSTNFLYYTAGIVILGHWGDSAFKGLFTLSLGIANLGLAAIVRKRKGADNNLVALLIGLSLLFISLAAPVQFKGNNVVLFWAAETVILYWLYTRTKFTLLRQSSFILFVLTLVSLALMWSDIYLGDYSIIPIIVNKGFITSIVVAIALFLYFRLLRNDLRHMRIAVLMTAIAVTYLCGALEIYYQFSTRMTTIPLHVIYLQAYTFTMAIVLLRIFRKSVYYPSLKLWLMAASFITYLIGINDTFAMSPALLNEGKAEHFSAHWIAACLLIWLLVDFSRFFSRQQEESWIARRSIFTWLLAGAIVFVLSIEMYHVFFWTNYRNETEWVWWKNLYYKAGLTILWGLCSFAMMWLGMKKDYQPLRIISLTLFTITLLKLFLLDIRNMPPGGKIFAFILLGVLLLAVSFMYQRLKKIIIDNKQE